MFFVAVSQLSRPKLIPKLNVYGNTRCDKCRNGYFRVSIIICSTKQNHSLLVRYFDMSLALLFVVVAEGQM